MNLDLTREEARLILEARIRRLEAERAAIDHASRILDQASLTAYEYLKPTFAARYTAIGDALASLCSRLAVLR